MLLLMKICGHRRAGQQPARAGTRATLSLLLAHHRVGDRAVNAVERVRAAQFLLRLARGGYGLVVEVRPQPDQPVQPVHRLAQRQLRRALPRRGSGTAEVAERAHGIPELLLVLLRVKAGANRRAQPVHPERARSCAAGPAAQSGSAPVWPLRDRRRRDSSPLAAGCGAAPASRAPPRRAAGGTKLALCRLRRAAPTFKASRRTLGPLCCALRNLDQKMGLIVLLPPWVNLPYRCRGATNLSRVCLMKLEVISSLTVNGK